MNETIDITHPTGPVVAYPIMLTTIQTIKIPNSQSRIAVPISIATTKIELDANNIILIPDK